MDQHPEADPWISRVIQVCKADSGGTKSILERLWTSRLSTRLYCGITEKKLHFSYLLDVTVLHADSWKDSRCVENSKALPREVLRQMKDYQEMEDWVRPLKDHAPFLVSHRHYRHIRADKVTGRGLTQHTVLFLSLDSGAVHKVLEQADHPFIIAELRPFRNKTHIQNMLLQSSAKKLYVSSSTEVVELDLYDCQSYGHWCEECVKARDPYCGWDGTKCTAASGDEIQDIEHGNYTVCEGAGKNRKYTPPREVYSVSPSAKFFLQCPMLSSHALYSWHHKGRLIECLIVERQCLLLIENMSTELQGNYSCVASEGGYERTQVQYELRTEGKARRLASSLSIFMCLLVTQTLLI
ncbi:hypothetical protein JZ751_018240 [Albula glossodonta]|uniref:Uncharacterized protein n=1 Tax=Albula glossodonta TaxID=121402 RepID=A0A8T2NM97_9TELE|nr:hypothetical protein JZ751_018240 [Albula glossodonta]